MRTIGAWLLAAATTLSAVAFSLLVDRTRGKPMRAILSWLLAEVTILFSMIMTRPVGQSSLLDKMPDSLWDPEWFGNAVGVAVGLAAVLVAMTAGAARGLAPCGAARRARTAQGAHRRPSSGQNRRPACAGPWTLRRAALRQPGAGS